VLQRVYKERVAVMLATFRSGSLKRTQKGSEGESTESGLSAVNDMSSEILYLLDPAQGLCMLEGNISRRVTASCERRPGVARPLALHTMSSRQPVRP
jgi:hypothetical protein